MFRMHFIGRSERKGFSLAEALLASFLLLLILGIIVNSLSTVGRIAGKQLDDNQLKRECLQVTDQFVSDLRGCDLPVLSYRSGTLNHQISLPSQLSDQETQQAVLDGDVVAGAVFNDHRGNQITYTLDSHGILRRSFLPADGSPAAPVALAEDVTSLSFQPYNAGLGLKDRHWRVGVSVGREGRNFPASGQFKIDVAVRADIADAVDPRLNPGNDPINPVTTTSISGGGGGGGGPVTTSVAATTSVPVTTTSINSGNPIPNLPNFRSRIIVLNKKQITVPDPPKITVGGVGGVSLPSIGDIMYSLPGSRVHSWHGGTYDCWGLSDLMFNAFTNAGYGARILTFATGYSSNHRQVQVLVNGGWQDIDPRDYGYDWLFATHSAPGGAGVIAQSGGADFTRANQLAATLNARLNGLYQLVDSDLLNNAANSKDTFDTLRTLSGQLNAGTLGYSSGMTQLGGKLTDIAAQYAQIRAQVFQANQYLLDQRSDMNEVNAIGAGNPIAASWAAGMNNAYNQLVGQVRALNAWFNGYRGQVNDANQWYANARDTNDQMISNYNNAVTQSQQLAQTIDQMGAIETNYINPAGSQISQNTQAINNLINQMNSGAITQAQAMAQISQLVNDNQSQISDAGTQMNTLNAQGQTLQTQYQQLQGYTSNLAGFTTWNQQTAEATHDALSSLNQAQQLVNDAQNAVSGQQNWLNSTNP